MIYQRRITVRTEFFENGEWISFEKFHRSNRDR